MHFHLLKSHEPAHVAAPDRRQPRLVIIREGRQAPVRRAGGGRRRSAAGVVPRLLRLVGRTQRLVRRSGRRQRAVLRGVDRRRRRRHRRLAGLRPRRGALLQGAEGRAATRALFRKYIRR